ncbi:MAG: hypothetical protein ABIS23_08470 [Sphingomicrobium sp.]
MHYSIIAALSGALASSLAAQVPTPANPAIADHSLSLPANGTWSHLVNSSGSEARFLDAAARPQLTLACHRATRVVTIARPASGAAPFLQVWATSLRRNLPASFNPATGQLRASLSASDSLLDALAMSRGRIAVGIVGKPAIVAPVWGEIARVVEECRS